jgi:hypothetical protein
MGVPEARPRPTAVAPDDAAFNQFDGIINTKDAKEIGRKGLRSASNVEIDNDKRIMRRNGYSLFAAGAFRGAYANQTQATLHAVVGTNLVLMNPDGSSTTIKSGLSPNSPPGGFYWAEDPANYVAYTNGFDSGIIRNGTDWVPMGVDAPAMNSVTLISSGLRQVLQFHIGAKSAIFPIIAPPESALLAFDVPAKYASTNLYACPPGGDEYMLVATSTTQQFTATVNQLYATGGPVYPYTVAVDGFPNGARCIQYAMGRLFAAEYVPTVDMSVVWISLPLQYHLFNKAEDFLTVVGEVVLMIATEKALLIGTDNQIYSWDGTTLTEVTQYGVVAGSCGDVTPDGVAYFWTVRGIAKAFPYELLTEQTFSGDPGVFNHARLFYSRGYLKLLASTVAGNTTFNQRTVR